MDEFLRAAIQEAELGFAESGIPIGSVVVHNGQILGRGHNRRVQQGSVVLHGEMDALENAGRQRPASIATAPFTPRSRPARCAAARFSFMAFRVWWLAKIERFAARKTCFAAVGWRWKCFRTLGARS